MTHALTRDDIADILQVFGQSDFAQLELAFGLVRVAVNRAAPTTAPSAELSPATEIVAPLLGLFQAGPDQGAPAFVRPGSKVEPDTTVGLIRVMRETTPVKAGLRGIVVEVLAHDGELIEYGQALLRLRADASEAGPS